MKIHNVAQGSADWYRVRLGLPTASEFHRIVTPTGKLSAQAKGYACRLVAELLLERPLETIEGVEWMTRGKELEPEACRLYEFETEEKTEEVGFVTDDLGLIGCSPDRLVGSVGLLEIKCPAPNTHVGYLTDGFGNDYHTQVQGQLYVTGREWCDRFAYHPELPPHRERSMRDEPFIKILAASLSAFCDMKAEMYERIRGIGFFSERERIRTVHEIELQLELEPAS